MILIADIGGTNARLELVNSDGSLPESRIRSVLSSGEHDHILGVLECFLDTNAGGRKPSQAVIALAAPVRGNICETTNLPWKVDAKEIETALELEHVCLLNDLEAAALGLRELGSESCEVLQEGEPRQGNKVLIAAGTGLGEAGLIDVNGVSHAVASEGGHTNFGPTNELEVELWHFASKEIGAHLSWERLVSGPGLILLYRFLCAVDGVQEPEWLREDRIHGNTPKLISRAALDSSCNRAERALDLFSSLYGAEAGNLALKFLSEGGVYLAGGIAPQILPFLRRPGFRNAFCNKGRYSDWMESLTVSVVLDEDLAVQGALSRALEQDRKIHGRPTP